MQPEPIFTAVRKDGIQIVESPSVGFVDLKDYDLAGFFVSCDGQTFGVDLSDGTLIINEERLTPKIPLLDPPRLVYYKRMRADMNQFAGAQGQYVYFVALGWQITDKTNAKWKNVRFGIKVFPRERRWEVTEDI